MKNGGKRKIILSIVLLLFLAAVITLGYRTITYTVRTIKERSELANERAILQRKEQEKNTFNNQFRSPLGGFNNHFLDNTIDKLIDSNKTNLSHPVEFIYNGETCGIDAEKIRKVKEKLDPFKDYDVSYNYDNDGYINQFIVVEQRETAHDFNFDFEHYAGTNPGSFVENLLTNVITNNTKNTNYPIALEFNNVSYGTDIDQISNIKDKLGTFTKYEVSFAYDNDGYIIKVMVVVK